MQTAAARPLRRFQKPPPSTAASCRKTRREPPRAQPQAFRASNATSSGSVQRIVDHTEHRSRYLPGAADPSTSNSSVYKLSRITISLHLERGCSIVHAKQCHQCTLEIHSLCGDNVCLYLPRSLYCSDIAQEHWW